MHVLIIEAGLTGHHSGYLERIVAAYMEEGHEVTVTVLQRDVAHPAVGRLKGKFSAAFNVVALDDVRYDAALNSRFGEPGRELALRRLFGQSYSAVHQSKPVDYVFLPYLDYCLYALGLLGSPFGRTQWGGICMRPSFHYSKYDVLAPIPKMAAVKRELFKKLLQIDSLKCLYTIDELLHHYVINFYSGLSKKICYLPDPVEVNGVETYHSAREKLNIKKDTDVILVYGSLDERKGLVELTDFLIKNPRFESILLVVAGVVVESFKLSNGYIHLMKLVTERRCILFDKYIDKADEQSLFVASDFVWLGYKNHYSMSGVLVMAALTNKRVIATDQGLIGWYVRRYNLGLTLDICNSNQLCSVIKGLKETKTTKLLDEKVGSDLLTDHTWENFLSIIKKQNKLEREK